VVGFAIDGGLVLYSKLAAPSISLISLVGPLAIFLVYALLAWFILPVLDRLYPRVLRWIILFGSIGGAIFAGEILLEYILLPTDNTNYGLVEFGCVFFILFLSAWMASFTSKSLRQGILTAVTSAMVASLIWSVVLLVTLHAFNGTSQQAAVWQAEGTIQDFVRSGMKDFYTFTIEDNLGATFFHLLLAPILAAVLGLVGGLLGKLLGRMVNID